MYKTNGIFMNEITEHTIIPVHKPDLLEMFFFLISGIIISIPFTIFYEQFADQFCFLLPAFQAELCSIAILAPFIEEFAKAYPLFYRHGETQRSIFSLGLLTGLGFGITEFFLYIFIYQAPIVIRLPGLLFHAASTSIVAYGIATRKPIQFYLVAVFLHFSYNFFTVLGNNWYFIDAFILILTYLLSYVLYTKTAEKIVNNV
jgi:RsiW-degrading membrane proteinase PrsW (M82 family)